MRFSKYSNIVRVAAKASVIRVRVSPERAWPRRALSDFNRVLVLTHHRPGTFIAFQHLNASPYTYLTLLGH